MDKLEVVTPGVETPVRNLSGGNVQKVLVGREIASSPRVLMVAYPVRGLDINSAFAIYRLLNEQKSQGAAVLCVGEDLDVLVQLCDKILVLSEGTVAGIVDARKTTKEDLGMMMPHAKHSGDSIVGPAQNLPKGYTPVDSIGKELADALAGGYEMAGMRAEAENLSGEKAEASESGSETEAVNEEKAEASEAGSGTETVNDVKTEAAEETKVEAANETNGKEVQ